MKILNRIIIAAVVVAVVTIIALFALGRNPIDDAYTAVSHRNSSFLTKNEVKVEKDDFKLNVTKGFIEVELTKSSDDKLRYELHGNEKKVQLQVTKDSNRLSLNVEQRRVIAIANDAPRLLIQVPTNKKIDLDVNISAGQINLDNVELDDVNLENNAGDLNVDNVVAKTLTINNNVGAVHLKNNKITNILEIDNDAGEVYISEIRDLEKLDVVSAIGEVFLQEIYVKDVSIKSNVGDVTYTNDDKTFNFENLDVDVNLGTKKINVN